MYALDNNSGVSAMPAVKHQQFQPNAPRWFTEGGNGVAPSYPGADWFNIVQAELLNILTDGKITPVKGQFNQITLAIKAIVNQAANAKWTAVDASLSQKGIVQLSSSTTDSSENKAATPKAVKTVQDAVNNLQSAVNTKSPSASPTFSGTVRAPTPAQTVSDTTVATTAYVRAAISALVGTAPTTLDTLGEIAKALAGDANVKATLLAEIGKKANANHTHTSGQITDFTNAVNGIINRDFTYQKIGDFEIYKFPSGMMIQTYRFTPPNSRVGAQFKEFSFDWALAFKEKPKIWIQHNNLETGEGSIDMNMYTTESKCTPSKVFFWAWEAYYNNYRICFDFLAIGRWK